MFDIQLPKNHFLAATYPNQEAYILGAPIPIGWGDIHDIVPFCIDTVALKFKVLDRAIHAITEIRSKGIALSAGSYIPDLTLAEFVLAGTPYLAGGATCYFSVGADYAINGTDYLQIRTLGNVLHTLYEIDGTPTWAATAGRTLGFNVFGKKTLQDAEEQIHQGLGNAPGVLGLRDAAARTRLGDSFEMPEPGYFLTRVQVFLSATTPIVGSPTGNLMVTIFSAIAPEAQAGRQGDAVPIVFNPEGQTIFSLTLPQDNEDADLLVDIEAPDPMLTNGADVLEDLVTTILGKPAAVLDAASLANFGALRAQEINPYIDREDLKVGDFIGKLEASLLFKFIPLQDGTYGTIIYEAGEPAGTPHFRDEDIFDLRIEHDVSVVRNVCRVKYDESPKTQEFKVAEAVSDYARLFYSNEETMETETWLKSDAGAAAVAGAYSFFFDRPETRLIFRTHGKGLELIPGRDKVKITKSRAAWAGGAIAGELFRIRKISKRLSDNEVEFVVVPDARTIAPGV